MPRNNVTTAKASWWLATAPWHLFVPWLPPGITYIKGQLETGEGGFRHWQFVINTKQCRLSKLKTIFGDGIHFEPSKSAAANEYVHKEETSVAGTRFELGQLPFKRNSATDWQRIRELAMEGNLQHIDIPGDVFVKYYHSLRSIAKDSAKPVPRGPQEVNVYWGKAGSGKTRKVFDEVGEVYYIKTPTTKWFDGYRGEETIIIDEFRGVIDVSHILKWLDRYPCAVEVKGSQVHLKSRKWYITSNLRPEEWYPLIDNETKEALLRRLTNIIEFN